MNALLVGSSLLDAVSEQRSVAGDIFDGDGGVRVAAHSGGVDQAFIFAGPAMADVNGKLLFAREAPLEEITTGALPRRPAIRDILEWIKIFQDLRVNLRLLQIAGGVRILRFDEGPRLGALGIFKPAIIIGDLGSEVVIRNRGRLGGRGLRQGDAVTAVNGLGNAGYAVERTQREGSERRFEGAFAPEALPS